MSVAAIVLAAGMSQRMGLSKMLLPLGGKPLLACTLDCILSTQQISPIFTVTGYQKDAIESALAGCNVVKLNNSNYATGGMLSSVKTGVKALPEDCEAFFLVLGDQPLVQPQTLLNLLDAWRETGAPIVIPTYEGRRGHPVLFAAACASEILTLPEDATLKAFVVRRAADILDLAVYDPFILADIDTPEDYERALKAIE